MKIAIAATLVILIVYFDSDYSLRNRFKIAEMIKKENSTFKILMLTILKKIV